MKEILGLEITKDGLVAFFTLCGMFIAPACILLFSRSRRYKNNEKSKDADSEAFNPTFTVASNKIMCVPRMFDDDGNILGIVTGYQIIISSPEEYSGMYLLVTPDNKLSVSSIRDIIRASMRNNVIFVRAIDSYLMRLSQDQIELMTTYEGKDELEKFVDDSKIDAERIVEEIRSIRKVEG